MEKKNIPFISVPNILHVLVSKTVGCVLNAYLPILCGVCEDDWAQRGTVHLHGFCGIIPDESRNLFSGFVFVYHPPTFLFFFLAMGLSCVSYVPIHCRFIGLRWFVFSLLFFFSNLISSSCSNLSSSNFHISLLFFYLLHPASTILLVPLLSSFSSLYSNYNKTSKILNKINNN